MPSYTWLQAIRILAGREPGHPHIPSTTPPVLECAPPRLMDMLAEGIAVVTGVPSAGDMHETIPAAAWKRIRIVFLRSTTMERSLETVAQLPGGTLPDLTASRSWSDLQVSEQDMAALKAAAISRPDVDRAPQSFDLDLLTLEEASLIIAVQTEAHDARQRLLDLLHDGKLEWHYATPIVQWQQQPLWLEPDPNVVRRAPVPHPQHWRVRRDQLVELLSTHPSRAKWRTCVPELSKWPWTTLELALTMVGRASGYLRAPCI